MFPPCGLIIDHFRTFASPSYIIISSVSGVIGVGGREGASPWFSLRPTSLLGISCSGTRPIAIPKTHYIFREVKEPLYFNKSEGVGLLPSRVIVFDKY